MVQQTGSHFNKLMTPARDHVIILVC